jgi:hypothetical protein
MRVVSPTSTPATSLIASSGPGVPSKGTPRSRARGFAPCGKAEEAVSSSTSTETNPDIAHIVETPLS